MDDLIGFSNGLVNNLIPSTEVSPFVNILVVPMCWVPRLLNGLFLDHHTEILKTQHSLLPFLTDSEKQKLPSVPFLPPTTPDR